MSDRRSISVPSYRKHKQSGQAVVTLTDQFGRRRDVLLGRHGTAESRLEYARVIAEWEAAGRALPAAAGRSPDLTVSELLVRFWRYAEGHYRKPTGEPTSELTSYRYALKPLRALYGHTLARDFGPLALKAVRQRMIEAGHCRGVCNQNVARIKRAFKWAVAEELVPPSLLHGLQAVVGLQRGRTEARDTDPVGPVPAAQVDAVLPHLPPTLRAMVELQRVTGMRPGEVCAMRPCDLDMSGPVWLYRPPAHKTLHRGKGRVVPLGPKAQDLARPFVVSTASPDCYLFSPLAAMAERMVAKRAARKSPVQPSQMDRSKARARRKPSGRYSSLAYGRAVNYACKRAGVSTWSPNRLRHNYATDIRRRYGLEAAQVLLGHSKADVTQVYAERDLSLAEKVAAEIG